MEEIFENEEELHELLKIRRDKLEELQNAGNNPYAVTKYDVTAESAEIKEKFFVKPTALPEVKCYNPAFDVTDHSLITAIITEKGIWRPPYEENFEKMFGSELTK